MDHETTREAVQTFYAKGYLKRMLEAAWGETLEEHDIEEGLDRRPLTRRVLSCPECPAYHGGDRRLLQSHEGYLWRGTLEIARDHPVRHLAGAAWVPGT